MRHLVTFKVAVAGAADNLGRLIIGKRAFDEKIDQDDTVNPWHARTWPPVQSMKKTQTALNCGW
jgi:hypothetical protein